MSGKPGVPVLVTGFGPFGVHKINISWEIAKVLKTLHFESYGIDLITEEIPVVYSVVSKQVPALWKKYKPQLVIHMGVTSIGSEMTMEVLAHKNGYAKVDTLGKLPEHGSANGEKEVIHTKFNLEDVCNYLSNSTTHEVPIHVSSNAGRYLCEFTYYNSLNVDNSKVVFVHVPDFNIGYTVMQMALVIKEIIFLLLEQRTKSVKHVEQQSAADWTKFGEREQIIEGITNQGEASASNMMKKESIRIKISNAQVNEEHKNEVFLIMVNCKC